MLKKTAIAAGFGLALSMSAQAEYQWEAAAAYSTGDIDSVVADTEVDADIDVITVEGSWFLAPVDSSKGALSEAAFLDRATRVDLSFSDGELDFDADDADISGYGLGGRWVFDPDAGWFVDAAYSQEELENEEFDNFTVGGGKYLLENTTVALAYTYTDSDSLGDGDIYSVTVEHYMAVGENMGFKAEAAYAYADPGGDRDTDNYLGRGTFYVTPAIGVGAQWLRSTSGSTADNWSVFAEWFVTEKIAVMAAYEDIEQITTAGSIGTVGGFGGDGDTVEVGALIRF